MFTKVNPNEWKKTDIFSNAQIYINKNRGNAEILEWENTIKQYKSKYEEEMEAHINAKAPTIECLFEKWERSNSIKDVSRFIAVCCLMFIVFSMFGILKSGLVVVITSLGLFLSAIVFFISFIFEKVRAKKYQTYLRDASTRAIQIDSKYKKIAQEIFDELDNIYLMSLTPDRREVVLLTRKMAEQQRQYNQSQREFERRQKEESCRKREEERRHWEQMEEEQRKARKAQEELLEIERERERDRQDAMRKRNSW